VRTFPVSHSRDTQRAAPSTGGRPRPPSSRRGRRAPSGTSRAHSLTFAYIACISTASPVRCCSRQVALQTKVLAPGFSGLPASHGAHDETLRFAPLACTDDEARLRNAHRARHSARLQRWPGSRRRAPTHCWRGAAATSWCVARATQRHAATHIALVTASAPKVSPIQDLLSTHSLVELSREDL
jgi:hypothetical protein